MVVVNRMSSVASEALRNRSEPTQPQPSKLYAEAKEAIEENEEWGVSNPYGGQQPAKKIDCSKKPKTPAPGVWFSMKEAQKDAFTKQLKTWIRHCKGEQGAKPPAQPTKQEAETYYPKSCKEQHRRFISIKMPCGPCLPGYAEDELGSCVEGMEMLNPFRDEEDNIAPEQKAKESKFKRGNQFERRLAPKKKEIKLCDCPPATRDIPVDILAKMKSGPRRKAVERIIEDIRKQAVCVEKCKEEGRQILPEQMPEKEVAPKPKPKEPEVRRTRPNPWE